MNTLNRFADFSHISTNFNFIFFRLGVMVSRDLSAPTMWRPDLTVSWSDYPSYSFKFQRKQKYHSWAASMWRIQDPIDDILISNPSQFPLETQPTSRTGLRRWRSTVKRKQGRRFLFRFWNIFFFYPARARAWRACALRALGLLLADGAPAVGRGKTFWQVSRIFLRKQL